MPLYFPLSADWKNSRKKCTLKERAITIECNEEEKKQITDTKKGAKKILSDDFTRAIKKSPIMVLQSKLFNINFTFVHSSEIEDNSVRS